MKTTFKAWVFVPNRRRFQLGWWPGRKDSYQSPIFHQRKDALLAMPQPNYNDLAVRRVRVTVEVL